MQKLDRDASTMTTPDAKTGRGAVWRVIWAGGLILLLLVLCAILFRASLAESAARQFCRMNDIYCQIDIDVMSPSRLAASNIRVLDENRTDMLALGGLDIALDWPALFRPGVTEVTVKGAAVTLDLTGKGHPLGKLAELAPQSSSGGAPPRVHVEDAQLKLITQAGRVDVHAVLDIASQTDMRGRFTAAPASLVYGENKLSLSTAKGAFEMSQGEISGDLSLQLDALALPNAEADDISIDAALRRADGPLALDATARAAHVDAGDSGVETLLVELDAVLDRPGFPGLTPRSLLGAVRGLELRATSGAGRWRAESWAAAEIKADLLREGDAPAKGDAFLRLESVEDMRLGAARLIELTGALAIPRERAAPLLVLENGGVSLQGASLLREGAAHGVVDWMTLKAPDPVAAALAKAGRRLEGALSDFDVTSGVAARLLNDRRLEVESLGDIRLTSVNGVEARVAAAQDDTSAAAWRQGEGVRLAGSGAASVGQLRVEFVDVVVGSGVQTGGDIHLTLKDGATDASLLAQGVEYASGEAGRLSAAKVALAFTGSAYGGTWSGFRLDGAVTGRRKSGEWSFEAPHALDASLESLAIGGTRFEGASTRYRPDGPLLRINADGVTGRGGLAAASGRLMIGERRYDLGLDGADVAWRMADGLTVDLAVRNASFDFLLSDRPFHLTAPDGSMRVLIGDGWKADGAFSGGTGGYDPVRLSDIAAKFHLFGGSGAVSGAMEDLTFRMRDAAGPARFAASDFSGALTLAAGQVKGTGELVHPLLNETLARVSFEHDLSSGRGGSNIASTLLHFSPDGLQPALIFPVLRGLVANVRGPVALTGGAQWGDGLNTHAAMELTDVSFVSEKAGLFEGVFGRIELTDVLKVKSRPGQTIVIHQWNPGLPLKDGEVRFRLDGLSDVALEGASFPFAGGRMSAEPMIWDIDAAENQLVVSAEGVDLEALVTQFGLKEIKADGQLTGAFPVRFSTGKAQLVDARLLSRDGWFAYAGEVPDRMKAENGALALFIEALKDFHYSELAFDISGDLAGEMVVTMSLEGHNPAVLDGYPFAVKMEMTADLMSLLNRRYLGDRAVRRVRQAFADMRRDLVVARVEEKEMAAAGGEGIP